MAAPGIKLPPTARIAHWRLSVILATFFYAAAIHYSHIAYLYPEWEYFGFTYRAPGFPETLLMCCLLIVGSILLPAAMARPSSIVLLMLFMMVYVPSVVITLSLDAERMELYGPSLSLLGVSFFLACLAARYRLNRPRAQPSTPGDVFVLFVLGLWSLCCLILVYKYASIMRFVGLSDIYEQRAAGSSGENLTIGYIQTYFDKVLSPALVALGLVKSRMSLIALGTLGSMIMFMINAQRTSFMLPFVVIGLYFVLRKSQTLRTSSAILVSIGAVIVLSTALYVENVVASFLALFLNFRTLGIPGLAFSQYHDLFAQDGYTWWSHVRGLNLLVSTPDAYVNDPNWPRLGPMIGERFYNNAENNVNANLFAGDGLAAAGAFGVGVIGLALAAWLRALDRASVGWRADFAILAILPTALALTNAHLFTTLLSFGGFFWMLAFYLYKPGRWRRSPPALAPDAGTPPKE